LGHACSGRARVCRPVSVPRAGLRDAESGGFRGPRACVWPLHMRSEGIEPVNANAQLCTVTCSQSGRERHLVTCPCHTLLPCAPVFNLSMRAYARTPANSARQQSAAHSPPSSSQRPARSPRSLASTPTPRHEPKKSCNDARYDWGTAPVRMLSTAWAALYVCIFVRSILSDERRPPHEGQTSTRSATAAECG